MEEEERLVPVPEAPPPATEVAVEVKPVDAMDVEDLKPSTYTGWHGGATTPLNKSYINRAIPPALLPRPAAELEKAYNAGCASLLASHDLPPISVLPPPSYYPSDSSRLASLLSSHANSNPSLYSTHIRLMTNVTSLWHDKGRHHAALQERAAAATRKKGLEIGLETRRRHAAARGRVVERALLGEIGGEDISVGGRFEVDERVLGEWR
jgi:hypothetical protein